MSDTAGPSDPKIEQPVVLDLVASIQRGEIKGKTLTIEDRQACVAYLTGEGYSAAEIARVLGVADRTIARDRRAVRRSNSVHRDPALVDEMVGRLLQEADTAVSRLRRIARDRATAPATKVDAERTCWQVTRELVRLLQRLGYLPEATRTLRADVRHQHAIEPPGFEEIAEELERLEKIQGDRTITETGNDQPVASQIIEVRQLVARMAASDGIHRIRGSLTHDQEGLSHVNQD